MDRRAAGGDATVNMNADVHPTPADQITNWDYEADVVIAGYGIAGAAAAVEAASAGADVLVLERTGGWGGAAAMAGGFIYLGGGTALQHACGFDDSVDNMAAFLNVAMGPGADENASPTTARAASSTSTGWSRAVCRSSRCSAASRAGSRRRRGPDVSGGENAYPFNTIATPAPRGHVPQMANKRRARRAPDTCS